MYSPVLHESHTPLLQSDMDALVRLRRRIMACEFELLLSGHDEGYLRDAGEEALDVAETLERQLSVFVEDSEVSYINAMAAREAVRVEPRLYKLFKTAAWISDGTGGAFDITAGPLVELWGFAGGPPKIPSDAEIEQALNSVGMRFVHLDDEECTVRFLRDGVQINLGALGKGYAVGEVASFLRERGVNGGLISAGTSTVYALGNPPDAEGWTVGIRGGTDPSDIVTSVMLKDRALSTSGGYEQYAEIEGRRFGHIVDPRTGRPVEGLLSASAVTDNAAESDALSTAFFVLGIEGTRAYCRDHPGVGAVFTTEERDIVRIAM